MGRLDLCKRFIRKIQLEKLIAIFKVLVYQIKT